MLHAGGQQEPREPPVPAFKRKPAACQYCQARKLRCDRKILGSPCTNCRLDKIECVPGKSKTKTTLARLERHQSAMPKSPNPVPTGGTIAPRSPFSEQMAAGLHHEDQAGLPRFIKPLSPHLTLEDMDYLSHKGVFELPDARYRNEILHSYIQFVHPLLPLLDLEDFLGAMVETNPTAKLSLLLFYAVMCSGAAHVHIGYLQALGYESRKSARRAFFERARVSGVAW